MSQVSVWAVMGPSLNQAYQARRDAEQNDQPYNGPMDDESYRILSTMADLDVVQPFYKTKSVQGQDPFTLFGMNFPDEVTAQTDMDYLVATWPGNQIEIQGAWYWDTGLPMGVSYIYDKDGNVVDTTGSEVYPLSPTAYELMPDSVNAQSNDDLVDINLVAGQSPRNFIEWREGPVNVASGVLFVMRAEEFNNPNRVGYDREGGFGQLNREPGNLRRLYTRSEEGQISLRADGAVPQNVFTSLTLRGQTYLSADAEFTEGAARWRWPLQGAPLEDGEYYQVVFN